MPLADARLFHVNVNCASLERSRRFYADGLGFEIGAHTAPESAQPGDAFGLERARWDASIMLGRQGYEGGAIDLLEWHEPGPIGTPPAHITECGLQRLGVRVPDLDEALARIAALGGRAWSDPLTHNANGHDIRIVMAEDPDGIAIELVEGGETTVSFVAIACHDLDHSLAFYESLGFREVARYASDNADGTHLRVDGPVAMVEVVLTAPGGGDALVILVGFRVPAAELLPPRAANTVGMWRAAFLVGDLPAATTALAREGIATISAPVSMEMGAGLPELRFVCFRGPDGEVIELIEQPRV